MREFQVGGRTYRAGKLDTFTQFHVARRLLPLLAGAAKAGEGADTEGAELVDRLRGAATALAALSDEDCDYVLGRCLSVVTSKIDGDRGWGAVYSVSAGKMFDQTIGMLEMLQIAGEVIIDNLANFSAALPSGLSDLMKARSASTPSDYQAAKTGS